MPSRLTPLVGRIAAFGSVALILIAICIGSLQVQETLEETATPVSEQPDPSPDGTKIAYDSNAAGGYDHFSGDTSAPWTAFWAASGSNSYLFRGKVPMSLP